VDGMMRGGRYKAPVALAFCAVMLAFARPDFRVDLASMNTVSRETLEAEKLVAATWGDVFNKVYLMTEAPSIEELQEKGDRLVEELRKGANDGVLSSAFVPTMIFPGKDMMKKNIAAWNSFWTPERIAALKKSMEIVSKEIGFARGAFNSFYKMLSKKKVAPRPIPEKYFSLLGIRRSGGSWTQFSILTAGSRYNAEAFNSRIASTGLAKLFDPGLFGQRLGAILLSGFARMAVIVGIVTVIVALLYLLNIKLTLIAMAPMVFSLICTFGTMNLFNLQMGIPTIMVTVIVIGMGTDYALYIVRATQRYRDESHKSLGLIRMTVFLSAASTMIGFGALSFADHALLRNAGLTLLLGIGYSYIGTITIVPPLLKKFFVPLPLPGEDFIPGSKKHAARVRWHYRLMEPYPRFFAYFKMKLDPMFSELHGMIKSPKTILDIGTGFGVPSVWLLELYPGSRVFGIEPDEKRRLTAALAIGDRGYVAVGKAPDIPAIRGTADAALAIDMIHYLRDDELALLFGRLRKKCSSKGVLIIRSTILGKKRPTFLRLIERVWTKIKGLTIYYRSVAEISKAIKLAGFSVSVKDSSNRSREEKWFIAKPEQRSRQGKHKKGGSY
jgi:hypothetical protein